MHYCIICIIYIVMSIESSFWEIPKLILLWTWQCRLCKLCNYVNLSLWRFNPFFSCTEATIISCTCFLENCHFQNFTPSQNSRKTYYSSPPPKEIRRDAIMLNLGSPGCSSVIRQLRQLYCIINVYKQLCLNNLHIVVRS